MDRDFASMFESCPTLVELLQAPKAVGRTGRVYENFLVSTLNNLLTIQFLMKEARPLRTLEIGLAFGGSALLFCSSHKQLGRSGEAQHIALDPYQTLLWDCCGVMAVERAGLQDYLDFREICSALELPKLVEGGDRFGLVYIDGSHLFEDVFVDSYFVTRLLTEGGVVLFDDSSSPHVSKVLRFLRSNLRAGLEELNLRSFTRNRFIHGLARRVGKVQPFVASALSNNHGIQHLIHSEPARRRGSARIISGSLAILLAILRASSLLSNLAAARRPGSFSMIDQGCGMREVGGSVKPRSNSSRRIW
jgi:hypothetical protein